jgi:hypothetical protein
MCQGSQSNKRKVSSLTFRAFGGIVRACRRRLFEGNRSEPVSHALVRMTGVVELVSPFVLSSQQGLDSVRFDFASFVRTVFAESGP